MPVHEVDEGGGGPVVPYCLPGWQPEPETRLRFAGAVPYDAECPAGGHDAQWIGHQDYAVPHVKCVVCDPPKPWSNLAKTSISI